MKEIQLEDVRELCKNILKDCRLTDKDEEYSDSLNFYCTNDFYYEECWNLDVTIAALILPRLIHFRDSSIGTPGIFYQYDEQGSSIIDEKEAYIQWIKILNKMIDAFYLVAIGANFTCDTTELSSISKRIHEGLELFSKFYLSLWD